MGSSSYLHLFHLIIYFKKNITCITVQLEKQIPTYMHHYLAELMPFEKLRSKECDFESSFLHSKSFSNFSPSFE